MQKKFCRLVVIGLLGFSVSFAQAQSEREIQAQKAALEFKSLQFFSEGRGMMLSPGLIEAYDLVVPGFGRIGERTLKDRWGLVFNDEQKVAGLHNLEYKSHRVGVMGCVACHSGRAAGQYVIGLGNKNIDVVQLGKDVYQIERYWKWLIPPFTKNNTYRSLEKSSMKFSNYLANENIGNLTQGLVPISFIKGWFYRVQGLEIPQDMNRGQVKVPHLWGYGEKRKVGQFCDGYGDGSEVGWAVAVELAAGQKSEVVHEYYSKVKEAEAALEHLLPPSYPFLIQRDLANRGQKIFEQTCAKCHGIYERDHEGFPIYREPKWIPHSVVQTDSDRLDGITDEFNSLVDVNPLRNLLRYKQTQRGYFAPRLDGVWARFPYLHNGSVPSLADLLTAPEERPMVFSLKRAGEKDRYDSRRMGLTLPGSEEDRQLL
ncbi:MAG: c-type cytochrome, partial [Bdellovibrionales bacterium]|nr:c-type cytochrome [Bdellovibrionales bacterium]